MYQEKVRTLHIYLAEEDEGSIVDAAPVWKMPQPQSNPLGIAYCWGIGTFFTLLPFVAIVLAAVLPSHDALLSKTLTLTLAVHPTTTQVQLYRLPTITWTNQIIVPATGTNHLPATKAIGLLTFYNGLFAPQMVPTGTSFTSKDGIVIITLEKAIIPPATPTTPPTDGIISVTAVSEIAGTTGNVPAQDVHQVCCGGSILVQNLYAFSGGQNEHDVAVVTQSDITNATMKLQATLNQQVHLQAQQAISPEQQLLPLSCASKTKANQRAGDQAPQIQIVVSEVCALFAYTISSVQERAMTLMLSFVPHAYSIKNVSVILLVAAITDAKRGSGTITVHITAFLQAIHPRKSGRI